MADSSQRVERNGVAAPPAHASASRAKRSPVPQTGVSTPDEIASPVLADDLPPIGFGPTPGKVRRAAVQAKADSPGGRVARLSQAAAEAVRDSTAAAGTPLPAPVREPFERAFGASLSDVRVQSGPHVARMGAQAFTYGNQVHFAPGRYDPSSARGRNLLGHELTHVMQQRAGRVAFQGKGMPLSVDTRLEREADELGSRAANGERIEGWASAVPGDDQGVRLLGVQGWGWIVGQVGTEVAREIALRAAKGKIAELLTDLDSQVLAEVARVISTDPEMGRLLRQLQLGEHAGELLRQLSAPLAEQVQHVVASVLDAIVAAAPIEYAEKLRAAIETKKQQIRETLGESVIARALAGAVKVVVDVSAALMTHMAFTRMLNFAQARAMTAALGQAKTVVGSVTGPLVDGVQPLLDKAKDAEDVVKMLEPLMLFRKPVRKAVQYGAEKVDEAMGGVDPMPDVQSVEGLSDRFKQGVDKAQDSGVELVKKGAQADPAMSKMVKAGAIGLKAAFMMSELARAKTYTDTTIALLKPGVMFAASFATGPWAPLVMVGAPIAFSSIMRLMQTRIEPTLAGCGRTLAGYRALKDPYDLAVFLGGGMNALPGAMVGVCRSLLFGVYGLLRSAVGTQPQIEGPRAPDQPAPVEQPLPEPGGDVDDVRGELVRQLEANADEGRYADLVGDRVQALVLNALMPRIEVLDPVDDVD